MSSPAPCLSIIVPVYKVEPYLAKCIESIISQTFQDWELILIDDGSPDACPAICDSYAVQDARIRAIHQPNAGVSAARNRGLELARGGYIAFVDSDDYLAPNCYSRVFEAMAGAGAEMGIFGFLYEYADGRTEFRSAEGGVRSMGHRELVSRAFDIPWSIRTVTYNKVFKRTLLEGVSFRRELKCCEDTYFFHECLMKNAFSAVFVKEPLYINLQRPGSAMHGGLSLDAIEDSLSIHRRIAEETGSLYPELYDKAFAYYMDSCVWKMNDRLRDCAEVGPGEQRTLRIWESRIRRRVLSEWRAVLRCPLIGWKQKLFYFLVAAHLR